MVKQAGFPKTGNTPFQWEVILMGYTFGGRLHVTHACSGYFYHLKSNNGIFHGDVFGFQC